MEIASVFAVVFLILAMVERAKRDKAYNELSKFKSEFEEGYAEAYEKYRSHSPGFFWTLFAMCALIALGFGGDDDIWRSRM
jgi:hypothetical protein